MRGKGICYDTGFFNRGVSTHEPFDPEVVARELRVIRDDLHCTAVRITGGDLDRLERLGVDVVVALLDDVAKPFGDEKRGRLTLQIVGLRQAFKDFQG